LDTVSEAVANANAFTHDARTCLVAGIEALEEYLAVHAIVRQCDAEFFVVIGHVRRALSTAKHRFFSRVEIRFRNILLARELRPRGVETSVSNWCAN
jgi:hypothetical protein